MAPRFRRRRLVVALFALAAAPAFAQGVSADTPLRPAARAVALMNARVVVAPGRVLDRATVVVRDGRIEAVGRGAAVPFDADVVDADSLTVYAGFIDAFGYAGVPKPPDREDPYRGDPGDPPRERAGIVPDRDVRDMLDATDARIKQLREVGFTAAHMNTAIGVMARSINVGRPRPSRARPPARSASRPATIATDTMRYDRNE